MRLPKQTNDGNDFGSSVEADPLESLCLEVGLDYGQVEEIWSVQIPTLSFDRQVRAAAVPAFPAGFDGVAGFRFLNRFTYGNFGDPTRFGLES